MKTSLDAIDRKILKYLIKNARMPFLEIARECGISGAAIHQRIRKLDEAGVILGIRLKSPKWHPGLILFVIWLIILVALSVSSLMTFAVID